MSSVKKAERLLRFTAMVHRRKGMSEEDFNEHWTNKHQQVVKEFLAKHGVVKYTQFHCPSALRKAVSSKSSVFSNANVADWDGIAEFYVRDGDFDFWDRITQTEYYKEVIAKDEAAFFDAESSMMMVGWVEMYIEDGQAVASVPNYVVK